MTTKVVVIGKDARSAQIVRKLRKSGADVSCLSDLENPVFMQIPSKFHRVAPGNVAEIVNVVARTRPDLVVIGPEEPLFAGVVDEIQSRFGTPCFGPRKELAKIEWSKSFARDLLKKYEIEGALPYRVFCSMDGMEPYLRELGNFVIKADGLMGGKGVKVYGDQLTSIDEALQFANEILRRGLVVVEERVDGEEFSLQSFCDGERVLDAVVVQDHKRAFVGDLGPNTGGMGSYSCADHGLPFLDPSQLKAASKINAAVIGALQNESGTPYRGVLYGGYMATADGVRVIEFNARLGDPEALNIFSILETDFLELFQHTANGTLNQIDLRFRNQATVCKYLVPEGYPDSPAKDQALYGLPEASDQLDVIFGAVRQVDGTLLMTGSRAVALVGVAETVASASALVETAIAKVEGPVFHRKDIGTRELLVKRVEHMERLRKMHTNKVN